MSGPMDLERLKALCEKATPGPWRWYEDEDGARQFWIRQVGGEELYVGLVCIEDEEAETDEYAKGNADFIAAAREAMPQLIQRLEMAERVVEAAETFARCEHASGCLAQCRCGAVEQRNEARAEYYRVKRAYDAPPTGGKG